MINLLPPRGKSQSIREYWVRVFSIWSLLISLALFSGALFFVPSYTLVHFQMRSVDMASVSNEEGSSLFSDKEGIIRKMNLVIEQLSLTKKPVSVADTITSVMKEAGTDIFIQGFEFAFTDSTPTGVTVSGNAPNRGRLSAFRNTLGEISLFTSVTLPISDLAREENLPFSIKIEFAKEITEGKTP